MPLLPPVKSYSNQSTKPTEERRTKTKSTVNKTNETKIENSHQIFQLQIIAQAHER